MRLAILAVLLAACGAGCRPKTAYQRVTRPEGPQQDEVLVLARAKLDPEVFFWPTHPMTRMGMPDGTVEGMALFFTDSPDKALDRENKVTPADGFISAIPGEPIAFRAPRQPLYLRRIFMSTTQNSRANTLVITYVECADRFLIDVQPDDEVVYAGLLTCHHEDPSRVEVTDEWDLLKGVLSEQVGNARFAKRLATVLP